MSGNSDESRQVTIEYVKSAGFRTMRADGAIGGATPQGFIHAALYSERVAIPQRMVHEVTPEGRLGQELPEKTVSRGTIIREMEVDLFLTAETARNLGAWLLSQAERLEQRTAKKHKTGS